MLALKLGAVFLIILTNAFFVAAEYALITARKSELEAKAAEGSRRAALALRLLEKPIAIISVCQIGVTVASIVLGAVGEPLAEHLLKPVVVWSLAAVLIGLSSITYLHVVFGELAPKAIALKRAEGVSMTVAWPIRLISRLLHPFVTLFSASAALVARLFGIDPHSEKALVTSETELRLMIAAAEEGNLIEEDEEELIYNVFDFGDLKARDAMVARPSILTLSVAATADEAIQAVLASAHSRVPLWKDNQDMIVGILHARDLFACFYEQGSNAVDLESLARPALIIPETKKLSELLADFRREHQQIAVVLNEYGAVQGIVTLEDLMEQLVGEIADEFDRPEDEQKVTFLSEHVVRVDGFLSVEEFNDEVAERWQLRLQNGEIHTVGGYVFTRLGRAPQAGDTVTTDELELVVLSIDSNRIAELKITKL